MRRVVAAALLVLATGVPAPAQGDGPTVDVTLDRPAYVYYRPQGSGDWQRFGDTPRSGAVQIPAGPEPLYEVRAEAPGLFTTWSQTADELMPGNTPRSLQLQHGVLWGRVVAALVLAAAAGFLLVTRRAKKQHEETRRTLVKQVEEAESKESLFSAEGRLPSRIGPYRVRSRLGMGGMAVVFKVEDEEGHILALKIPLPHLLQDPEFMGRFRREMRVCATLNHPRIVRIEEFQPGGDGQLPYFAMEYVPGKALEPPQKRPAALAPTLDLAAQVLDGLEYVHAHGITHRDLKPSNLMMTSAGAVKIMDFGIARREQTLGPALTRTDQVLGTPEYMAPEQIASGQVGPATDLYALGIILYEQLAGVAPFQGELFEVLSQKLMQDPPPLQKKRPDLDPKVVAFVERLMARDLDERFPDAASAREALRELRGL